MNCPKCNSGNIVENGFYNSYQKYGYKDCNAQFSKRSFSFFCRHRFLDEVIKNAMLYAMFINKVIEVK